MFLRTEVQEVPRAAIVSDHVIITGYFRGRPLEWINNRWVFSDTNKPLPATGGEVRACVKCGALYPLGEGEVDPCLGILPGVDNACCGHGVKSQAYVRFTNGVVLRNFDIETLS